VEADLGLVRYLAAPLGTSDENVMRWFILAARPPGRARRGHPLVAGVARPHYQDAGCSPGPFAAVSQ
jgi:hypothetical protein